MFPPYANCADAVEVASGARLLFISGLNGYASNGKTMPADFEGQAELIWSHLDQILGEANMSISDLVSLRFYLATPAHDPANVAVLNDTSAITMRLAQWCAPACSNRAGSSRSKQSPPPNRQPTQTHITSQGLGDSSSCE